MSAAEGTTGSAVGNAVGSAAAGRAQESFVYPLSYAQQRLYFLDFLLEAHPVYAMPELLRLQGSLDCSALERALRLVLERYDAFRTTFRLIGDRPVQVVQPRLELDWEEQHVSGPAHALEAAADFVRRPFDLAGGPLTKALLLVCADDDHLLVVNSHHIVSDGWSVEIVNRELGQAYSALVEGRAPGLPQPARQYPDFTLWQRDWARSDDFARRLDRACARLADVPPLALGRPVAESRYWGTRAVGRVDAAAVDQLARSERTTAYAVGLAAWWAFLHHLSGQDSFAVGSPVNLRRRRELEEVVGFCVNMIALKADLAGVGSFRDLVGRARTEALAAQADAEVPFESVVEAIGGTRSLTQAPVFQALYSLNEERGEAGSFSGLTTAQVLNLDWGIAKYDLSLWIDREPDGLSLMLEVDTDRFDAADAERLLAGYRRALAALVESPDAPLAPLLSPETD